MAHWPLRSAARCALIGLLLARPLPALAEDANVKDDAKEAGHAIATGARDTGHAIANGARALGEQTKTAAHQVKRGAKKVWAKTKEGAHDVKDKFSGSGG